jgi:putative DNA primase/helicase
MSGEHLKERLRRAQELQRWALRSEAAPRINAMLDLPRSEPGIPVLPENLDRDPWLFNCPNGTVELRNGQLREHRREDLITKMCPTEYHPEATCPLWCRFLEEVFAGDFDLIDYLKRLFGYALTGDTSEHLLAVFHGGGANGKSVLVNTLLGVLGEDYGMMAMPDLLLSRHGERHPTEIADLFGKRLLVCQETGAGRRLNEPLVKWLTGGDKIRARRMREDFWEFNPTHKVILVSNHKPEVRGTDFGIWRCIRLIPFNVTFPEDRQDKALPAKLGAEAQGILAWCVAGCREWQAHGMVTPQSVLLATEAYRADEDVLAAFIADCCMRGDGYECKASDLYLHFRAWQERMGEKDPLSQKKFGAAMTARGFERFTNNGTYYRGVTTR